MINLLFVIGSPRPHGIGNHFSKKLEELIHQQFLFDIKIEIICLSEINYENCLGCTQCFVDGECRLSKKDFYDFDKRLERCHGIVMFIPTYLHQMPGKLKNCFDRMAYRFHEFPLIGKKAVTVTYTASNGADGLSDYMKGMFTMLGAEVVDSQIICEINDPFELAIQKIFNAITIMINKIRKNNYQINSSQEKSFEYLKSIVQTELEQNIKTYKQKRWEELNKYDTLKEYVEAKFVANI